MVNNQVTSMNQVGNNGFSRTYGARNNNYQHQNFQLPSNQNNQFQMVLSQLLPLLMQLLSNLQNNNKPCDTSNPKQLSLSDAEKKKVVDSIYADGVIRIPVLGRIVDSVIDNDCSGGLSIGDVANVIVESEQAGVSFKESTTITEAIMGRYNLL